MLKFIVSCFVLTFGIGLSLSAATCHSQEAQKIDPRTILKPDEYTQKINQIDWKAHNVNLDTFLKWRKDKNTIVVDLRHITAYQRKHIEGAIHLGSDISEVKLAKIVPDKETRILLYCDNSLYMTRMLALTTLSLPQFIMLGYENTYMLESIWHNGEQEKQMSRIPMVSGK